MPIDETTARYWGTRYWGARYWAADVAALMAGHPHWRDIARDPPGGAADQLLAEQQAHALARELRRNDSVSRVVAVAELGVVMSGEAREQCADGACQSSAR